MRDENKIIFKGELSLNIIKEGDYYVASCPTLDDLSSYGKTEEEAQKNFGEALAGTILILKEEGKLHDFLVSCGWQVETNGQQIHIIPPFIVKTVKFHPENITSTNLEHAQA